jgi:hypothetical protein
METEKLQQEIERSYRTDKDASTGRRITSYYSGGVLYECPEGYLTGEEFVKKGIENINEFCNFVSKSKDR